MLKTDLWNSVRFNREHDLVGSTHQPQAKEKGHLKLHFVLLLLFSFHLSLLFFFQFFLFKFILSQLQETEEVYAQGTELLWGCTSFPIGGTSIKVSCTFVFQLKWKTEMTDSVQGNVKTHKRLKMNTFQLKR